MIAETAGPMETLLWAYAKGKPVERLEQGGPGAFAELSDGELKGRLLAAGQLLHPSKRPRSNSVPSGNGGKVSNRRILNRSATQRGGTSREA